MIRRPQSSPIGGFMLIEVLIALLIFSLGVLGLVSLQANATKDSGQAQYRAQAVLLANELVGMMWSGDHSNGNLVTTYASDSTDANYLAWIAKVKATLPQTAAVPVPAVTVATVDPLPALALPPGTIAPPVPTPSTRVTIQVSWGVPGDTSGDAVHNVTVVTQIK